MDVNLRGVFNCIRAELQRMDKDASIVSTSSVAGLKGYGGAAAYSTSKVRGSLLSVKVMGRGGGVLTCKVACCHRPYTLCGSGGWSEEHQG